MTLKLGGERELVDVDIKTSTIAARKLFLNLVWGMKPEVVTDLLRLFNIPSVPVDLQASPNPTDFSAKVFLLHTKFPHCYSMDLTQFGYKADVRRTPVLAYFDYIFRHQKEFDRLLEKSEIEWKKYTPSAQDELIIHAALDKLIPDWKTLQSNGDSDWLCSEVYKWGEKWNLKDDWCLNLALECLKQFKVKLIDNLRLPEDYLTSNDIYSLFELNRFWNGGMAWHYALIHLEDNNYRDYFFPNEIPDYPQFNYVWNLKAENGAREIFSIKGYFNPLHMFSDDFRRKLEKEFWSKFFDFFPDEKYTFVGNSKLLTDELNKFQQSVDYYISKVEKIMKPHTKKTIVKKSGDKHFRWLIEYQISNRSYNKLSNENTVDRKAVMNGIQNVSKIIGLTLRPSLKGAREKGSTDKIKGSRRRI